MRRLKTLIFHLLLTFICRSHDFIKKTDHAKLKIYYAHAQTKKVDILLIIVFYLSYDFIKKSDHTE